MSAQAEVADALTQTLKTPVGTDSPRKECHYVNAAGFGLTRKGGSGAMLAVPPAPVISRVPGRTGRP